MKTAVSVTLASREIASSASANQVGRGNAPQLSFEQTRVSRAPSKQASPDHLWNTCQLSTLLACLSRQPGLSLFLRPEKEGMRWSIRGERRKQGKLGEKRQQHGQVDDASNKNDAPFLCFRLPGFSTRIRQRKVSSPRKRRAYIGKRMARTSSITPLYVQPEFPADETSPRGVSARSKERFPFRYGPHCTSEMA